ncbi:MAG: flagellar motor protein MotB [Planctomycetota bacterium]
MSKRPIVIVNGAPEWVVTFGDMMSLMLTFFILLFSISEIKTKKVYDIVGGFKTYFNVGAPGTGFHNIQSLSEIADLMAEQAVGLEAGTGQGGKSNKEVNNPYGDLAQILRTSDQLLISIAGRALFDEHSAALRSEARAVLDDLRVRLRGRPNRIRIIGHSSPAPLPASSGFADHTTLGFDRARAVADYLSAELNGEKGIRVERIELGSRGAFDPIPGVNVLDRDERRQLDRVDVIVTPENALKNLQ